VPKVIPPLPDADEQFFWDAVTAGRLLLRSCAGCGQLQHPPSPMCPHCGSLEWANVAASGRGTVHSWIVSRHPTDPDDADRIVALIDLEEGVRLVSNLTDVASAGVTNGMAVEVVFRDVDGTRLPQFVPAGAAA
jgi:uncharacterized OB-fold protein